MGHFQDTNRFSKIIKVEKIFKKIKFKKGSLDLIQSPSPSVKIQIKGGKVCLRYKGKTFENKKFVDYSLQCFVFTNQANFPPLNLNFHSRWKWWDWIQDIFLNLFYIKDKIEKNEWLILISLASLCFWWARQPIFW